MKQKTYIFLILIFSICVNSFAQQISYTDFFNKAEKELFEHNHTQLLKSINNVILNNPNNFSKSQIDDINSLKVQVLADATFLDDALLLSDELLKNNLLNNTNKTSVYIQRALIYEILSDFKKSYQNLKLAEILINKDTKIKKKHYAYWLIRMSSWYRMQGSKKKFYDYAVLAKKQAVKTKDYYQNSSASVMMSFYFADKNPEKALQLANEGITIDKKNNNVISLAFLYLNSYKLHQKLNNKFAYKYVDSAYNVIKNTNYASIKSVAFLAKSKLCEKLNQKDSALYYFKKHFENEKAYNFEQKANKIEQANFIKVKEENKQIQIQNKKQFLYIISLTLFSICTILVLYLLYIRKQKLKIQKKQIEEKNIALAKAAKEKDFYVKELNHRVKNNLAVILSLIDIQEENGNSEILQQLHDRVNTIALGHQLYTYGNSEEENSNINLKDYVSTIFQTKTYASTKKVEYKSDSEEISLNVDLALPIGLILNELITNSIKHAETTNNETLFLELKTTEKDKNIEIIYSDNGINFKPITYSNSLGLYIIDGMTNQISGTYTRENSTYKFILPNAK